VRFGPRLGFLGAHTGQKQGIATVLSGAARNARAVAGFHAALAGERRRGRPRTDLPRHRSRNFPLQIDGSRGYLEPTTSSINMSSNENRDFCQGIHRREIAVIEKIRTLPVPSRDPEL
jgi:hypothetical protein